MEEKGQGRNAPPNVLQKTREVVLQERKAVGGWEDRREEERGGSGDCGCGCFWWWLEGIGKGRVLLHVDYIVWIGG